MARQCVAFAWEILSEQLEPDDANVRPLFLAENTNPSKDSAAARGRRRLWWTMLGLVFCVAYGAGYRLYQAAEAGAAVLETELKDAIVLESFETANLTAASQSAPPVLQSFDLRDDVVAVEVVVGDASRPLPYRETRFYRQVDEGWQSSASDLRFWGPQQQMESKYFVFQYHRRDAAAVTAAAPALDAFYAQLHQAPGRPMPNRGAKVVVEISARPTSWNRYPSAAMPETIRVPSPVLLQIPAGVSDADAIALSARITLIYRLLPRSSDDWLDDGAQADGWWWPPLTGGLRLWLLWHGDSLPAVWRHDILALHFANACRQCSGSSESLLESAQSFCQTVSMLGLYSADAFSIPCIGLGHAGGDAITAQPSRLPASLAIPASPFSSVEGTPGGEETSPPQMTYSDQTVSMVALLDYVEDTYGPEQIPALLAAFGSYQEWDSLVPAIFGIAAEDFDAGWRAYVVERYSVEGF